VNKRVLYTAFDVVPSPKGASTHITYFTAGLVEAGYEVTLVTAGSSSLPEQESYLGATLLRAPTGDEPNFLKRALAFGDYTLAHLARTEPYAVAHIRSVWSGFPLAEARPRLGYKLLYEVNGLPSIELKYHYPALRNASVLDKIREWEAATLRLADAIICPAGVTAAYIASLGVSPDKITVIPNGIDTGRFQPVPAASPGALPTILYIGTLADWQGLPTLIAAMPHILARHPVRLRLVGRGRKRQRKQLEKQLRKAGLADHISIEPAVPHDQVPALIAQADVCVAPLGYNDRNVTQGCCPLKLLEYMASGRPIVASNLPVVRELVCPGSEALLFNPDDPEDLARQILTLLDDSDLAAQLGANAAARAQHCFTWQIAQTRLLQVYQRLLKPSRE
jgi:glycosyltransferase involved in cell wall biosynthesis